MHLTCRDHGRSGLKKEERKEREAKEAEEKTKGMLNPHKSLRKLLGEDKKKQLKSQKVPVVLCPNLTKVLRPHQIEGVKVSSSFLLTSSKSFGLTFKSFCFAVLPD